MLNPLSLGITLLLDAINEHKLETGICMHLENAQATALFTVSSVGIPCFS
jgi:hypothetical protein